jgi:hypothetical protein
MLWMGVLCLVAWCMLATPLDTPPKSCIRLYPPLIRATFPAHLIPKINTMFKNSSLFPETLSGVWIYVGIFQLVADIRPATCTKVKCILLDMH